MTATRQTQLRITDAAQARALRQNHRFLAHFLTPHSPSDIAASVGMAANLAHHHARKLAALGLLIRLERKAGKVAYQLAAREFLVASSLLPPEDSQGNGTADMQELSAAFLHAYDRSWGLMRADEDGTFSFGDHLTPAPPISLLDKPAIEPYPTHFDALTLRLTPERYARLARALSALIDEAAAEPMGNEGQACTLAVLAFEGVPGELGGEMKGLSRRLNSFLGVEGGGKGATRKRSHSRTLEQFSKLHHRKKRLSVVPFSVLLDKIHSLRSVIIMTNAVDRFAPQLYCGQGQVLKFTSCHLGCIPSSSCKFTSLSIAHFW